ncbi:MAG: hypothetical protein NWR72_07415 [Bacteroidia bacterium]|nr:hypothetical protein [Bacteroidia bacterium]
MVPHFLLKRIENIEGKTGRDYEIGFQIGDLYTQSHFGRSVSLESLENAFGEISDEDIEKNIHPFVEDHVFCRECEKRLAELESKYSKSMSVYGDEDSSYSSGIDYQIGLLFWLSLIWRLSISQAANSFLLCRGPLTSRTGF